MTAAPAARLGAWKTALFVFLAALLLYLPGLGSQEFVGTEDFRAHIAEQTWESGDLLVPRFYGRPILTKPPLHYWLLGATFAATGDAGPFSARLVSLFALAATCAVIAALGHSVAGARAGWVAALGYLIGLNTLKNGVNAEIDPLFAALAVGTVAAWWRALDGRIAWAVGCGALAGLAALAKGPAIIPFFAGAVAAGWWCGRRPSARMLAATLVPAVLIGGAWPFAMALRDFSGEDAIREGPYVATGWTGKMIKRTFLYPLTLFAAAAPLPFLALYRLRATGRPTLDRYLLTTCVVALAILMLPAGKSTRYLLPCFPLLALAGALRLELFDRTSTFVRAVGVITLVAALVCLVAVSLSTTWSIVAVVILAASGLIAWRAGAQMPVFMLAMLALDARFAVTQIYVPAWTAESSVQPAVAELQELVGSPERLAIVRIQTPRLTDPLGVPITYFHDPKDYAAAVAAGERFDAMLVSWIIPADTPAEHEFVGSVAAEGKDLRLYRPK